MSHSARHYLSAVARFNPYSLDLAGRRWSADWSLDGPDLVVRSAYGSACHPLRRRKPERLAEDLLREILRGYAEGERPHVVELAA